MCDLDLEARDRNVARDTPTCYDTHVSVKFRQIIFSGSEVTVRKEELLKKLTCDLYV
jgi:hypothetical protein